MPPLDEGSFLYMPSLVPAGSLSAVQKVIATQDMAIRSVPEVESVVGKLGRVESALDPAPHRHDRDRGHAQAPQTNGARSRSTASTRTGPSGSKPPLRWFWPDERPITKEEVLEELQQKTDIPGVLPTWLQPIQTRIVMLQTGFRAMMGVKIFGDDLKKIEELGLQIERSLKQVPGATDVVADRIVGKPYVEFRIDREKLARYGVNVRDVQDVIEIAIGGDNLTTTVEGRERYPIRVRYPRELRDNLEDLERILVPAANGSQVPISQVADIEYTLGPQEIKSENTLLVGYVTLNTRDRDEVSVVEDADALIRAKIASGELEVPAELLLPVGRTVREPGPGDEPPDVAHPAVPRPGLRPPVHGPGTLVGGPAGLLRDLRLRLRRLPHALVLRLQPERGGVGRVHRPVRRGRGRRRGDGHVPRPAVRPAHADSRSRRSARSWSRRA